MPPLRRIAALLACVALLGGPASTTSLAAIAHSARHAPADATIGAASKVGWSSSNWSGYAVTSGPYTSITGRWTVPTVAPSSKATYSSSWVGIDGFNSSTLIQTGTDQVYASGAAHYSAWWEIVPSAGAIYTSMTVHPGDEMSATIAKNATGGTWTITLIDTTSGETFSTTQSYSGTGSSAEWIQEAPTVGTKVASLAHYSPTTFHGTVNGENPRLVPSNGGTMVQNGVRVSTPSAPDSRSGSFSVRSVIRKLPSQQDLKLHCTEGNKQQQ